MQLETTTVEQRNDAWLALLRTRPHDLTTAEYDAAIPPRGLKGSIRNRVRGARIRLLNKRGFTVRGHVCK